METSFFLPTSLGDFSAVANLPDTGTLQPAGVVLLAGAHDNRPAALRELARKLARQGHAVLRFDYPGVGISPISEMPRRSWEPAAVEASSWFLEQTGVKELRVAGMCLGGRLALTLAAANPSIRGVVPVSCKLRPRRGVQAKARMGIAAFDRSGSKLMRRLTRGARTKEEGSPWHKRVLRNLEAAASHSRIHFVYGAADDAYEDFLALKDAGVLPSSVTEELEVSVLPSRRLSGFPDAEDYPWFWSTLYPLLSSTAATSPTA